MVRDLSSSGKGDAFPTPRVDLWAAIGTVYTFGRLSCLLPHKGLRLPSGGWRSHDGHSTQQYVDQFATAISEGRDAAATSVKEVLAKGMASVSGNNPANKEKAA